VSADEPEIRDLFGAASGGPSERARAELDRVGASLAAALRRAFPFMLRRGVPVTPEPASSSSMAALEEALGSPRYVIHLEAQPGDVRGALIFDPTALAFVFDGALGGDGSAPPVLGSDELTRPQRALVARFVSGVVPALSAVLEAELGLALRRLDAAEDAPGEAELATLRWGLGVDGVGGGIVLALDRAALLGAPAERTWDGAVAPAVVKALGAVELLLTAELGRVRLSLGELAALRVGDALTVPLSVGSVVPVRVDGRVLFEGHPTTQGTRVAVRITGGTHLEKAAAQPVESEATP
jgi:flagellar motor switch protein FliM